MSVRQVLQDDLEKRKLNHDLNHHLKERSRHGREKFSLSTLDSHSDAIDEKQKERVEKIMSKARRRALKLNDAMWHSSDLMLHGEDSKDAGPARQLSSASNVFLTETLRGSRPLVVPTKASVDEAKEEVGVRHQYNKEVLSDVRRMEKHMKLIDVISAIPLRRDLIDSMKSPAVQKKRQTSHSGALSVGVSGEDNDQSTVTSIRSTGSSLAHSTTHLSSNASTHSHRTPPSQGPPNANTSKNVGYRSDDAKVKKYENAQVRLLAKLDILAASSLSSSQSFADTN